MNSCCCSQEVVKVVQEVLLWHFKNWNLDFSAHSPKLFATSKKVARISFFIYFLVCSLNRLPHREKNNFEKKNAMSIRSEIVDWSNFVVTTELDYTPGASLRPQFITYSTRYVFSIFYLNFLSGNHSLFYLQLPSRWYYKGKARML